MSRDLVGVGRIDKKDRTEAGPWEVGVFQSLEM